MAIDTTVTQLTAEQVQSVLIQPLMQRSVILSQPGLRVFDTNGSQVRIPKSTGGDAATFVAEAAQIPSKDATFDELVLLPSTMKSVKTLTVFSNELARQSIVSLDAAIRDAMVAQVAKTLDTAFIGGSAANTPQGILLDANATVANAATGSPVLDDLMDAEAAALGANVNMENLRWLMNPRDWKTLRKLKDLQDRYQLTPDPTSAAGYRLLGYPVVLSNHVPATLGVGNNESIIGLIDFSQIAVARDLAPQVTLLSELYGDFDQQAIRVVARYDIGAMNPEAIVLLQGVTA